MVTSSQECVHDKRQSLDPLPLPFYVLSHFYLLSRDDKGSRCQTPAPSTGLPSFQNYEPAHFCSLYSVSGIIRESYKQTKTVSYE